MKKFTLRYSDGSELRENDKVLINDKHIGHIDAILIPGTEKSFQYSCEEGGFIVILENGDVQVWPDTDEDISLLERQ